MERQQQAEEFDPRKKNEVDLNALYQQSQQSQPSNGKKQSLLPLFDVACETYLHRVDRFDKKIAVRQDKIERNQDKIARYKDHAAKLEMQIAMLRVVGERIPAVYKIVDMKMGQINKINTEKIPNCEKKIEQHTEKLNQFVEKKEINQLKAERMESLSGAIKSVIIPHMGADLRRQAFAENMDRLKKSSVNLYNKRIDSYERRYALLTSELDNASALDQYEIRKKINKLDEKKKKAITTLNKITEVKESFSGQPDEVTDFVMKETEWKFEDTYVYDIKPEKVVDDVLLAGNVALDKAVKQNRQEQENIETSVDKAEQQAQETFENKKESDNAKKSGLKEMSDEEMAKFFGDDDTQTANVNKVNKDVPDVIKGVNAMVESQKTTKVATLYFNENKNAGASWNDYKVLTYDTKKSSWYTYTTDGQNLGNDVFEKVSPEKAAEILRQHPPKTEKLKPEIAKAVENVLLHDDTLDLIVNDKKGRK